jgi:hypothetical protein
MHGKEGNVYGGLMVNPEERDRFEDQGIDRRISLKWI